MDDSVCGSRVAYAIGCVTSRFDGVGLLEGRDAERYVWFSPHYGVESALYVSRNISFGAINV